MAGHVTGMRLPTCRLGVLPTLLLLECLLPSPALAQLAGRWRLSLEANRPMLAELVLDSSAAAWRGRILLEYPDSAPIQLSNLSAESGGMVRGDARGAGLTLELRHNGQSLDGILRLHQAQYAVAGIRLNPRDEFYPSPPMFVLRQLIVGSNQSHFRIPGRWLAAINAETALGREATRAGYVELALSAGLTPLTSDSLGSLGLFRAMGLYRREEMVKSAVLALEKMRRGITRDTLAARFNYLFRTSGGWIVDIHDYALARARRTLPTLTWETARPALAAAGLLERDSPAELEVIPLALYRLFALQHTDTLGYNDAIQQMRSADAESRQSIMALMEAYDSAAQWYVAVLTFLLEQPVFDSSASIAQLVGAFWGRADPVPEIRPHRYGYPEGATRVGADSALLARLIRPLNATAREWSARHPMPDLLAAAHLLPAPPPNTFLDLPGQRYRVTSIGQASAESFGGFLEPRDLILLDPSYQPLLALGTLVHEWQHLLHEHRRESAAPATAGTGSLRLTQLNPYLAEGLAEWAAERILAAASKEFPLISFGEAEKRMSLAEDDPHVLGYRMVRVLNTALRSPANTVSLLVRAGTDPDIVLRDSRVTAAWRRYSGPDRQIPRRSGLRVIPETRFQLVDDVPDVIETRLRVEGLDH